MDPELERQIETAIGEAVTRFGAAGRVRLMRGFAMLEGAGPASSVELGNLPQQWDALAEPVRQRRAAEIARELVRRRREAMPKESSGKGRSVLGWIAPLAILCAAGIAIYALYRVLGPGQRGDEPAPRDPLAESEQARHARAVEVCERTRTRVRRGATLGPADVEGWVVELSLLRPGDRPSPTLDTELSRFVSRRTGAAKFVWDQTPRLSKLDGPNTQVNVAAIDLAPNWRGLRLSFGGRYVTPYFEAAERGVYFRVAAGLAEKLGATRGALYARCKDGATHHVGSWFRAPDPAGAAATLLYFMGVHADVPHVRRELLSEGDAGLEPALTLARVDAATAKLSRQKVLDLVGAHGGMVAGSDAGPTSLRFPFKDANRATRASLEIAKAVELAPAH